MKQSKTSLFSWGYVPVWRATDSKGKLVKKTRMLPDDKRQGERAGAVSGEDPAVVDRAVGAELAQVAL